jgi:peptide/nickel transport system substrate-binding protein
VQDAADGSHIGLTRRWTRRGVLHAWGGAAIAATLLSACGPAAPSQPAAPAPTSAPPAAAKPTTAPAAAATTAPAAAAAPTSAPAAAAKPTAAPAAAAANVKTGGTFRFFAWTEDPPTLDPHINVSFRVQGFSAFFYSRLLMSKKGPGIPAQAYIMEGDLAESWQVAPDGKTYTFKLRPDTKWHNKPPLNGRPLTAQDVVWSFERFMKVSPQKTTFDSVASVAAPDDRTVVFTLKDQYAPFEAAIGAPIFWILPKEVVEADGDASKRVVGSGPFIFDKFENGVAFTGKKNPDYYRKGEPRIDEVVGHIIPDTATQMAGLRAHELDYVDVPQQELEALKKTNPEIQLVETEFNNIPFHYWRLDRPPYNDPRVRQAVSIGTNREERIKVIQGGRGNYNNFIPWALSEAWLDPRSPEQGPTAKLFKYDVAEAKRLLADAGYPNGFKADLVSTPGYGQVWVQAVELVQQDLKAIGIDATIKMQEYAAYLATTFQGKLPEGENVIVYGLETPFTEPHDFLFNMYHPKGTRNHAAVNDDKLTEMIEKQMRTVDKADRKKQIYDIQRYLAEQMYYPPSTAGMVSFGLAPWVRDFFPISDYGRGAEVIPKLWLDK